MIKNGIDFSVLSVCLFIKKNGNPGKRIFLFSVSFGTLQDVPQLYSVFFSKMFRREGKKLFEIAEKAYTSQT